MPPRLKEFLLRWANTFVGVVVATYFVPGIHWQRPMDLVVAALMLGVLNAFLRPLLMFLSLPVLILTLGLFTLVINGLLLYFVGWLLSPQFSIVNFHSAFWGAFVITVVSIVLNVITGTGNTRFKVHRGPPPGSPPTPPGGNGPVIDV